MPRATKTPSRTEQAAKQAAEQAQQHQRLCEDILRALSGEDPHSPYAAQLAEEFADTSYVCDHRGELVYYEGDYCKDLHKQAYDRSAKFKPSLDKDGVTILWSPYHKRHFFEPYPPGTHPTNMVFPKNVEKPSPRAKKIELQEKMAGFYTYNGKRVYAVVAKKKIKTCFKKIFYGLGQPQCQVRCFGKVYGRFKEQVLKEKEKCFGKNFNDKAFLGTGKCPSLTPVHTAKILLNGKLKTISLKMTKFEPISRDGAFVFVEEENLKEFLTNANFEPTPVFEEKRVTIKRHRTEKINNVNLKLDVVYALKDFDLLNKALSTIECFSILKHKASFLQQYWQATAQKEIIPYKISTSTDGSVTYVNRTPINDACNFCGKHNFVETSSNGKTCTSCGTIQKRNNIHRGNSHRIMKDRANNHDHFCPLNLRDKSTLIKFSDKQLSRAHYRASTFNDRNDIGDNRGLTSAFCKNRANLRALAITRDICSSLNLSTHVAERAYEYFAKCRNNLNRLYDEKCTIAACIWVAVVGNDSVKRRKM